MRQFHGEDDAQHDGNGNLDRHPAALRRELELGTSQVIGEPEDARSGHQWEDAAQQEYLRWRAEGYGGTTRKDAYQRRRGQGGDDGRRASMAHEN